jgi:hypothetical protein
MAMSATYVVDSNAKLAAWAANTAGNDYTTVLIKTGTWTINTWIDLIYAGTKRVISEAGNLIQCTMPYLLRTRKQKQRM